MQSTNRVTMKSNRNHIRLIILTFIVDFICISNVPFEHESRALQKNQFYCIISLTIVYCSLFWYLSIVYSMGQYVKLGRFLNKFFLENYYSAVTVLSTQLLFGEWRTHQKLFRMRKVQDFLFDKRRI